MSSHYSIHKPYVLAALPRPLDHTDGRIVAREVYGQRDGLKKRKRTELAVGIDGEATSIYDVPASRLVTSYPIPPQESFTCPPYSVRVRRQGSHDIARYTLIATHDAKSQKITLFKDVVTRDGKTTSTTKSQTLQTSAVQYLTCSTTESQSSLVGDVVAISKEGEVVCLSGETLAVQWTSSVKSAVQEVVASSVHGFEIEHVSSSIITDFSDGIFKNRPEVFSTLPASSESNSELLAIVAKSVIAGKANRHLVIGAALSTDFNVQTSSQRFSPLDIVPLPSATGETDSEPSFQIDAQSGVLFQMQNGNMDVYDVTGAIPKLRSTIDMDHAVTFARLSKPFVLSSSRQSIALYNHQYRSVHARSKLDLSDLPGETQDPKSCQLLSYYRSQDLVVALIDNILVSIQIEPPKKQGQRRKEGLLIDAIGKGTTTDVSAKKLKSENTSLEFSRRIPGTITESYLAKYHEDVTAADELLSTSKIAKWEALLLTKFRMSLKKPAHTPNGHDPSDSEELPEWEWVSDPSSYPSVDRRWVLYAISRIFSLEQTTSEEKRPKLQFILSESNVTTYLAVAGHLTLSNIQSAFREEMESESISGVELASDLIQSLAEADGSLALLLNYLQATKLGEVELLYAIRALMLSMDVISDTDKPDMMKLLSQVPHEAKDQEMDIDDLEKKVAIVEYYLGDGSISRSRGLTLAFTKLWRHPALSTVRALRTALAMEEVVSLMCLLRMELVRGAWTSLYIDPTSFDSDGQEPPPDGSIALIADLLGRCLDAVGAGGWLVNDAMSPADRSEAGDFLTALKLEASAALEGIEEATFLNGILGEALRFGIATHKSGTSRPAWKSNSVTPVQLETRESRLLPLGLKTKQMPSKQKVVSGGEVVQRSARETGHLISQKVEAYSLEKLTI